jgi:hypothetical protein
MFRAAVGRPRTQAATDEAGREQALSERNAALSVYEATDARLSRTQQDFGQIEARTRAVGGQTRALEADRNDLLVQYHANGRALRETEAERERLEAETQRPAFSVRRNRRPLRQTEADYVERDDEAENCAWPGTPPARGGNLRDELALMLGSRSWKLTRPLRFMMRHWHRLRGPGRPGCRYRLSRSRVAVAKQPSPSRAARQLQSHTMLRKFLVAEFGEAAAADVVARIEHYDLPCQQRTRRSALRTECTLEQALEWAGNWRDRRTLPRLGDPTCRSSSRSNNQAPFTLACIAALLAHRTRYSFEILVGAMVPPTQPTQRCRRSPASATCAMRRTWAFVRNCNATAAHATGRTLVFLNNDTQVLPGWLDELIGTLDDSPDIGLAGSKLVIRMGRLQECGAIIWRDGSAWNYGRLADPRRPEFGYLRDVDYVSGASIALRADLWSELGVFDELFVPAYAEDADLAFRVRSRGMRTVVQPLSQLLHFRRHQFGYRPGQRREGLPGGKPAQAARPVAGELAEHRDNAVQPELEKERGVDRRVLFIDHCTPSPDEDAGFAGRVSR